MEEIIDKASNIETKPRHPWNKGKIIGAKPPLRAKHVWSIRTMLQIEGRKRDLALFNLAIDSKLRGCDVVTGLGRGSLGYEQDHTALCHLYPQINRRGIGAGVQFS
jgi:hypothetical protein